MYIERIAFFRARVFEYIAIHTQQFFSCTRESIETAANKTFNFYLKKSSILTRRSSRYARKRNVIPISVHTHFLA